MVWLQTGRTLWFYDLDAFQEFVSSTKRPYAKELETVDFKDKLEETKGQINSSIKDLTDGKYLYLFCLFTYSRDSFCQAKNQTPRGFLRCFPYRSEILAHWVIFTAWISGPFLRHPLTWRACRCCRWSSPCRASSQPPGPPGASAAPDKRGYGPVSSPAFQSGHEGLGLWLDDPWGHFQLKHFTSSLQKGR